MVGYKSYFDRSKGYRDHQRRLLLPESQGAAARQAIRSYGRRLNVIIHFKCRAIPKSIFFTMWGEVVDKVEGNQIGPS